MNHPLSTAFTESHKLWVVVFYFSFLPMHILISYLISSVICWLFRHILFSLHMFVFLLSFSCIWHLIIAHCDQRRCLKWIQIFWIYQGYIYGPGCDLPWRRFHVHLRKWWNSLFWGEMSYKYQLGLTGPLYHLKFVFPCKFSVWLIYP